MDMLRSSKKVRRNAIEFDLCLAQGIEAQAIVAMKKKGKITSFRG